MKMSERFDKAADHIEHVGWKNSMQGGVPVRPDEPCCALEALIVVDPDDGEGLWTRLAVSDDGSSFGRFAVSELTEYAHAALFLATVLKRQQYLYTDESVVTNADVLTPVWRWNDGGLAGSQDTVVATLRQAAVKAREMENAHGTATAE